MDHKSYLGGVWARGSAPAPAGEDWGWIAAHTELFLRGDAVTSRVFKWDGVALLLRGYARANDRELDLDRVARSLYTAYRETGNLDVDRLDGAFTVALLDSRAERVLLYRNLVGTGATYYRATADGLVFSGNLTDLLPLCGEPRPNRDALPSFFLYRAVPGRETLFDGVFRLMPGEEIAWEAGQLTRTQRTTFADLKGTPVPAKDAVERTDAVMAAILRDVESLRPGCANLLSGGVDSSYIQAIYNQDVYKGDEPPPSYCIAVDHPMTWIDTDYAVTASMAIGTRHVLTPADGPYAAYLTDALARTGEPMNHVQSAYFGHLGRVMAADGVRAGLCGEGADSLFGVGMANKLHNAAVVERLLPLPPLRRLASGISGGLGWETLRKTIDLAGRRDEETDPAHPVNQVACFTDRAAVVRMFGDEAVRAAEAKRRSLLETYEVGHDPLDRLHAAGFLGEAVDSAGLWAGLMQRAGVDLLCPFLDSRMLKLALNLPASVRYTFRRPKAVLKAALARRATAEIAERVKLGFGQPVFEWLAPGGQLASLVSRVAAVSVEGGRPTWVTFSAVCYDVWHRLFIERSLPRPAGATAARRERVAG